MQYLAQFANLIKAGYRSNAFAPYAWYSAVLAVIEVFIMLIIPDLFIRTVLVFTFVGTIIFGLIMYYKMFRLDPRLLQSESFRLEDKKLDLISQKGSDIMIEPVNLSAPPNLINEGGNDV